MTEKWRQKHIQLLIFLSPFSFLLESAASAQINAAAEIPQIDTSDRIALLQIDQLLESGDWEQAVAETSRLSNNSSSRLIEIKLEASKQVIERWVPLEDYLSDRLMRWSAAQPQLLVEYRTRTDRLALAAIEQARDQRSLEMALDVVRKYFATSYGDDALLLSADLAIDRGWFDLARALISRIDSRLQASGIGQSIVSIVPAISWDSLLSRNEPLSKAIAEQITRDDRGLPFGSYLNSELPIGEVALRLPYASLLAGDLGRAQRELTLCRMIFYDAAESTELASLEQMIARQLKEPKPIGNRSFSHIPRWTQALNPPSPEAGRRGSYFPAVWSGHVLVHDVNRIVGFELDSGRSWPIDEAADSMPIRKPLTPNPSPQTAREGSKFLEWVQDAQPKPSLESLATIPLFDAGQPSSEVMPPANLPIAGRTTFSLGVFDDRLVARLGPPVTGWLPVVRKPPGSISQVAVFDLRQEGKLLDAYPASLDLPELARYEVEGTPILVGDRLIFGVTGRDGSLYTSRVLCIDLRTGTQLWQSSALAVSPMLIEHSANRVTHASVTYRAGTLYYHAALGTVAALDIVTGRIQWLVRYPRGEDSANPYRQRKRPRRQWVTPVRIDAESALVAAADCDRLVALNAAGGLTLWSSGPELGEDAEYILGATDEHWIVSGERLYWIDRHTGRVDAAFSAQSSHLSGGGITSPHSVGRGAISDGRIFWPTTDEILVFDQQLVENEERQSARLLDRIDLGATGLTGGNLLLSGDYLILTNRDRIAVFARE